MSPPEVVFTLLAIAGGLSAIRVVTSNNLIHAALYLALSLASTAGVFLVLAADFVALVQLLVYVGAVAVLFLFGLMLTRAPIGREALDSQNRALGLGVAVAMFGVLAALIVQAFGDATATAAGGVGLEAIGRVVFANWVLPFELLGMLLLAALLGAIVLSRREEGESGEHDPTSVPVLAEPPAHRDLRPDAVPLEDRTPEPTVGARTPAGSAGGEA